MSTTSRSFVATNAIVVGTLLIGFANNVAIAAIFGLTREVDAYYAALMLPNLYMALCLDYLGKNFLPILARARKEGDRSASELTSSVVTVAALLSLVLMLALAAGSGLLFRILLPGFDTPALGLVREDFLIMAPTIVFMTITAFHQYVCQHDEDYVHLMAIRAALPLANLITVLAMNGFIGVYALPVGNLAGQILVCGLMARRARYRYAWRISIRREWEGKIFTASAIVMGSGLLARTRFVIDNYLGSLLGSGAISALAMSQRLTEPLGRSVFMGVRLMMFSRTARYAVNRESREIARLYDNGLGSGFLLLAPVLWWMALNSRVIVDLVFLRGQFDARMAALVALALLGAVPSVLFSNVNALISSAFYALERVAVPAVVMPLGTVVYLMIAPELSGRFGVIGVTLGLSVSAAVVFVVMLWLLGRELEHFDAARSLRQLLRYGFVAGVCLAGTTACFRFFGLDAIQTASASLVAGGVLYVATLILLKDPMLAYVYQFTRKALPARGAARDARG